MPRLTAGVLALDPPRRAVLSLIHWSRTCNGRARPLWPVRCLRALQPKPRPATPASSDPRPGEKAPWGRGVPCCVHGRKQREPRVALPLRRVDVCKSCFSLLYLVIYHVATFVFQCFIMLLMLQQLLFCVSSATPCRNSCISVFHRGLANVAIYVFYCFIAIWQMLLETLSYMLRWNFFL
jgi:hypothetical protein